MRLVAGDVLAADGSNTVLLVQLTDSSALQMEGDVKVTIDLTEKGMLKTGSKMVTLEKGTVFFEVAQQPAGHQMVIRAPDSVLSASLSKFRIVTSSASTELAVSEGVVAVRRNVDGLIANVGAGDRLVIAEKAPFVARSMSGETRVVSLSLEDGGTGSEVPGFEVLKSESLLVMSKLPASLGQPRARAVFDIVQLTNPFQRLV